MRIIFNHLKYLQPVSYFNAIRHDGTFIFPVAQELPKGLVEKLGRDLRFDSKEATDYDLSYRAIINGFVGNVSTYTDFKKLSVKDNYLFLRKYFHAAWVLYVLLLRLISFKNPFLEIKAWMSTKAVNREALTPLFHKEFEGYKSHVEKWQPMISVIIPTLNRYDYLKDILSDLEQQDYKKFEIIIIDQSEPFNKDFYSSYNLDINLIRQEEKALWLARNTAIKAAKGQLIALSEDDVRVSNNWLSAHLNCLEMFKADISAGVFYRAESGLPKERSFYMHAQQFASGNALLYKSVFEKVGLFDRQFEKQRMGDGEFGLRAYLKGFKSISNPIAGCVDVKAHTGGLREMGSWDAFRPSNFFAPRPIPSVLYFFRKYFGNGKSRLAMYRTVPFAVLPYKFKTNRVMLLLGIVISIFLFPLVLFQVFKSWRLASVKLKEGPIIGYL